MPRLTIVVGGGGYSAAIQILLKEEQLKSGRTVVNRLNSVTLQLFLVIEASWLRFIIPNHPLVNGSNLIAKVL